MLCFYYYHFNKLICLLMFCFRFRLNVFSTPRNQLTSESTAKLQAQQIFSLENTHTHVPTMCIHCEYGGKRTRNPEWETRYSSWFTCLPFSNDSHQPQNHENTNLGFVDWHLLLNSNFPNCSDNWFMSISYGNLLLKIMPIVWISYGFYINLLAIWMMRKMPGLMERVTARLCCWYNDF